VETKRRIDGKKILVVDDEPDVLESLAEILDMCEVVKASSFDGARELLMDNYFDLAVLDIMGVDGYKLLDITNEREIIAVMLTAHALAPEHIVKSFKKGAAFYVPKDEMVNLPSFLEEVLEAVEEGKSPLRRWMERLGNSYCEKKFGPDWRKKDMEFWKEFASWME
jgi:DNA-binding NtrC family response regulator